jgi:hypothetical protein
MSLTVIVLSKMQKVTFTILFTIGIGTLIYFSWISVPDLSKESYIPDWLGSWSNKHPAFRTAVPLFFTGIIAGIWLIKTSRPINYWLYTWIVLVIFLVVAECGQLFLPKRIFDWMDILWGICGSFTALLIAYLIQIIINSKSHQTF